MFTSNQAEFCKSMFMSHYPALAVKAGDRIDRAARLFATNSLRPARDLPGVWEVQSESGKGKWYLVDPTRKTCTCPDSTTRGHMCKHRIAVGFALRIDQWSTEHTAQVLQESSQKAKKKEEAESLSLAYSFAIATEQQLKLFCWVKYQAILNHAFVYRLVKDHKHILCAIVKRVDGKPWYNNEHDLAVYAYQCIDPSLA